MHLQHKTLSTPNGELLRGNIIFRMPMYVVANKRIKNKYILVSDQYLISTDKIYDKNSLNIEC